ncbi:MAG: hypothetical protein NZ699_01470 [Roseiflexus sp.]|nr:hypothetical protein [Roseiflexus sp.]
MNIKHLVLLTALTFALAGCGIIGAAPTPTPVPPTPTPRPTETPLPTPTAAPTQPPTAASADVVQNGLRSATQANSYRFEFLFKAKGPTDENTSAADMPFVSPDGMGEILSMKGEVVGENSRVEIGGFLGAFLSGDPAKGAQILIVDGKSYIRGPALFFGAPDDAWYELPATQTSSTDVTSPEQIVASLRQSGFDTTRFTPRGFETLDGQRCSVFASGKEDIVRWLSGFSQQANLPSLLEAGEIDQAEIRVFICEDGRLHKMTIDLSGVAQGQTEPTVVSMLFRFYDFNSNIQIVAPANARPLPTPSLIQLTPTP